MLNFSTHGKAIGGLLFFSLAALFFGCQGPDEASAQQEQEAANASEFVTEVEAMVLQPAAFPRQLVSNGKLEALRKSRISFPLSETLLELHLTNGMPLEQGQLMAVLCSDNLQRRKQQLELRFERAALDMEDILLGRGFTIADSLKVPREVWQMAGIRSGYTEALLELNNIKADIANTRMYAPFRGVMAGLEVQQYEKVNTGEVLGTLIDNTAFLVRFPVMEAELPFVHPGAPLQLTPFAAGNQSWQGHVHSINPQIDEHGRVEVTAVVSNANGLMEGMNVRVLLEDPLPNQLVVPKSAVLYRDNLEVLFKYSRGKAEWTYVNVLHQNSTHYSVVANPDRVASLQPRDTVIISGNMNLAHGSAVTLKPL